MRTVLLIQPPSTTLERAVIHLAGEVGLAVRTLPTAREALQVLEATTGSEPPIILVCERSIAKVSEIQSLRSHAPLASILFLASGDPGSAPDAAAVPSISASDLPGLKRALTEAADDAAERARTRRALNLMNHRLAASIRPRGSAQAWLTQSADYFSGLVMHALDAILLVDTDGRIIFCNASTGRLFGIEQGRLSGQTLGTICRNGEVLTGCLERVLRENRPCSEELLCLLHAGGAVVLDMTATPVEDDAHHVIGGALIARDVGERRRAELERQHLFEEVQAARIQAERSERRYRFLAESIPQIVWAGTEAGEIDYLNERFREFCGGAGAARGLLDILEPGDRERFSAAWAEARRSQTAFELECRLCDCSGAYRWFLGRAVPLRESGASVRWFGTFTDINDRRCAEENARFLGQASTMLASSLEYEGTLSNVIALCIPFLADWCSISVLQPDGSLKMTRARHRDPRREELVEHILQSPVPGTVSRFSARGVVQTGESVLVPEVTEELLREVAGSAARYALIREMDFRSFLVVAISLRDRILGALSLAITGGTRRYGPEDFALAKELAQRVAYALDNARLYLTAQREIAERERVTQELRLSEARHRLLVNATAQIVWRADPLGQVTDPGAWADWTGQAAESATGSGWLSPVHPGDRMAAVAEWRACVLARRPLRQQFRLRWRDGSYRHVLVRAVPMLHRDGSVREWVGTVSDIEDRWRAEAALAAEKERLKVTLRSIGDGVIATDVRGQISLFNPPAAQMTGWSEAGATGRALSEVFTVFERGGTRHPIPLLERILGSGEPVQISAPLVLSGDADRLVAISGAPIRDQAGVIVGAVLVFRDVTLQSRIEEDFIKNQKLESIGVLAGGIAHDFNNVLTAILGNVALAKLYARPGDRIHAALSEAEKAFWRARDLTHQLLTFAKGGAPIKRTHTLGPLIEESCRLGLAGSSVRCEQQVAPDLWPVDFDAGQMSQVLSNLVINAKQAMPAGGTVRITAGNEMLAPGNELALPEGRYVCVSVADQGIGIPEAHLLKVFDPYFTTKQEGSGLGLAVAYSIVRRHEGRIRVTSQVGRGARFDIYLPASEHEPLPPPEPAGPPQPGTGRILLMDDEPMVRDIASELLSHLGYQVRVTGDGAETLAVYEEAQRGGMPFDAVILDLTIVGGMGGRECIQRLRALDPGVRAIASTGYSSDPIMSQHVQAGFDEVIEKPYDLGTLSRTLRSVLHS